MRRVKDGGKDGWVGRTFLAGNGAGVTPQIYVHDVCGLSVLYCISLYCFTLTFKFPSYKVLFAFAIVCKHLILLMLCFTKERIKY